tara:strand:- start:84 stop:1388 length:1305 start_codon:yes stop_codon:yes gene_type:complete
MKKLLIVPLVIVATWTQAATTFKLNPHYFNASNGAPIVFVQAPEVPMLDIKLAFRAGSAYDGNAYGLSALTTELMNQGNGGLDAGDIADNLADTGAQFHSSTSKDMALFELKTLSEAKTLDQAVRVFKQILSTPDFTEKAFIREKNQQLIAIKQALESPAEVANQTFFKALYQDHPYAHPVLGNETTVQKIKRSQVIDFYKKHFIAQNATLVMVGDISLKKAKQIADDLTTHLPQGEKTTPLKKAEAPKKTTETMVSFPSSQTVIRLGELGITHHNDQFFPLLVGNYILGGGALVSQLSTEIREKRGLTYGVYSQFLPLPATGPFIVSLSTENAQAKEAVDVTLKTIERFVQDGPSEQELTEAKQYLTGSFPLSLASNGGIADILLKISFYDLPQNYLDTYLDNINKTSTNEITRAFQNSIVVNQLIKVMVGKQ